ncbi:transglutaminase-like domain-containing protein [uncultured Draconibacterium sp.]|uniref:transglutaminase-like domain-containing protein n=1 Tax=uncultured Draconibacterium sp. TaxID=1573823 RepID=UPI0032163B0A
MKIKITVLLICFVLVSSCASFFSAINYSPAQKVKTISFSESVPNKNFYFIYPDTSQNDYLRTLRQDYKLDSIAGAQSSEFGKITALLEWSGSQWQHNGGNTPSSPDPLTILQEAEAGNQFRCVEYGILAAAALNSVGIPARVLGLKARDVAKVKSGAAHVVTEVYSREFDKWIFIDPQFNILPTKNDIPLNAIEFQSAIVNDKKQINLVNSEADIESDFEANYIKWIGKYLYFFDVCFDQSVGKELELKGFTGKTKLMLVPVDESNPTIFQRKYKINYCLYTNSVNDFYRKP